MSKKIIVIGGGPAGIDAAEAAAKAGAQVTLVSNSPIGGRAGWSSLLPSKVWLTTADSIALFSEADKLGISGTDDLNLVPSAIVERIRTVKKNWNTQQKERLAGLGVQFVPGTARFETADTIQVIHEEDQEPTMLQADAFIVASGSVPAFPPTMKPNGKTIIAPRFASALETLPESIAVVGGGATGTEFAYLFNRLGLDVTWIVDQFGVLPDFDPEAGRFIADTLVKRGVTLVEGQMASHIDESDAGIAIVLADGSRHAAAMAFLAIGRKVDVAGLNLEAAGLTLEKGAMVVDEYGRSAQPHIYFAGDVTGAPMIANKATAQGWTAGQHAAGLTPATCPPEAVIGAIYTEPQVAQVGTLTGDAVKTSRVPYSASMKTHLLPEGNGFVKLAYDANNNQIVGAVTVGHHAADVIAPVAVAVRAGLTVPEFGVLYGAHPTFSELAFAAARQV
ncbi:MAG: NAD(P)/FAD-dependent oxidoreductase [Ardenticatenaceae bacterium]|nr:NAD(P)/FAD-dependent oxidoreductase [Ardenticatenaceae bacterium]MCB9446362.1 NAD(P)/FAD-dependent oxidoreductase [Ardenticatenaceae bacterium]